MTYSLKGIAGSFNDHTPPPSVKRPLGDVDQQGRGGVVRLQGSERTLVADIWTKPHGTTETRAANR